MQHVGTFLTALHCMYNTTFKLSITTLVTVVVLLLTLLSFIAFVATSSRFLSPVYTYVYAKLFRNRAILLQAFY